MRNEISTIDAMYVALINLKNAFFEFIDFAYETLDNLPDGVKKELEKTKIIPRDPKGRFVKR